ncbi:MAG: class I SAM-dependent RNA methyltransferase [Lachnospiraceae bacterium]|nr:class I SAM-dependent RNA methyltransferase [Lachnospiraceae bacterium]
MFDMVELIAPCHFGLEAVLKNEITDLGYEITQVEDGRVTFRCPVAGVARANVFLRTAERVLLKVGSFPAETFEMLFDCTKALPWEDYIPADGRFWVTKASSVKSKLTATVTIQSVMKKAMVERLREKLRVTELPETGIPYPVRVFLMKDIATVALDTSGEPLHKRGYRQLTARAPISETLAAALLKLTPWTPGRVLMDPFCGSGTFLIEAAMMAADMAPGMNREFTAEQWKNIVNRRAWYDAGNEASDRVKENVPEGLLIGSDIDREVLKLALANARAAGVEKQIKLIRRDVADMKHPASYGFVVTNPPYGVRLEEQATLPALYKSFADAFKRLDCWSAYVITPFEGVEQAFGRPAAKKRKIYNGMLRTDFYSFPGPRPMFRKENA